LSRVRGQVRGLPQALRMKIATFMVNGINARLPRLLEWLNEAQPDVACLQELRAPDELFPEISLRKAGYAAVWRGQRAFNGVAILARGERPQRMLDSLPGDPTDTQARYIQATVAGLQVASLCVPAGNPRVGQFAYKLSWLERLIRHAAPLHESGALAVLAGDFSVVPSDLDMHDPDAARQDAMLQPEVREAYARLLSQGWCDAVRAAHPHERLYTWWDYAHDSWARDAGRRIDRLLLSAPLASRCAQAGVDRQVRGRPGASDHAPAWVVVIP
jgi:exodeoxyribonuclease-3